MKNYTLILLLTTMMIACQRNDTQDVADETALHLASAKSSKPSKDCKELEDSLMSEAYKRYSMWDTFWNDATYKEAYKAVRNKSGSFGFFYMNNLPYCVFTLEEWDNMTDRQRFLATKIAKQRYDARRLVKSFFMCYGEICSFRESFYVNEEGAFVSYYLSASQNDTVQTLFTLNTFVVDLQKPRFKYYSTMRERNPDPKNYRGLMERGAQPKYYGKWIDCNDYWFRDISTLTKEIQKILDSRLMIFADSLLEN